jgi:hypothetical protein
MAVSATVMTAWQAPALDRLVFASEPPARLRSPVDDGIGNDFSWPVVSATARESVQRVEARAREHVWGFFRIRSPASVLVESRHRDRHTDA